MSAARRRSLGKLGDARAVQRLGHALVNDPSDWMVRRSVVWALGEIGGQQALEALEQVATDEKAGRVILAARKAVNRIGETEGAKK